LRASDRVILLGLLSSLLERVPTRSVRLVIFNLDQQKILLRQDAFAPNALGRVAQALNGTELGLWITTCCRTPTATWVFSPA